MAGGTNTNAMVERPGSITAGPDTVIQTPGLRVVKEKGTLVIALGDQRVSIYSDRYTIERKGRKTTRKF